MFFQNSDISLTQSNLLHFLADYKTILSKSIWSIEERLWIYQLDKDGFLVFNKEIEAYFLKNLLSFDIDFVTMKDQANYYYIICKDYLNTHPELSYPSELRPKF